MSEESALGIPSRPFDSRAQPRALTLHPVEGLSSKDELNISDPPEVLPAKRKCSPHLQKEVKKLKTSAAPQSSQEEGGDMEEPDVDLDRNSVPPDIDSRQSGSEHSYSAFSSADTYGNPKRIRDDPVATMYVFVDQCKNCEISDDVCRERFTRMTGNPQPNAHASAQHLEVVPLPSSPPLVSDHSVFQTDAHTGASIFYLCYRFV